MLLPLRAGKRSAPFQELQQPFHQPRRELQQEVERQDRGEQRERRNDHRHHGDRYRIGDRPGDRHLAEEQQRRRREADRDRPLHASPLRDGAPRRAPAERAVEDEQHRAEGKPQSRREHRPGIEEDDHRESQRERAPRRCDLPAPQRRGDDRHHPESALRRHAEAGDERVAERRDDRRDRGRLARRQSQGERGNAPPAERDQPGDKARDHRDVQPGNAHQVRDAGAVEELPLLVRDGTLVADRERGKDSGGRRRAERCKETVAHDFSRLLDAIHRTVSLSELALPAAVAHVTGRTYAALEQPRLVVEPVRIDETVRPPQAQRQEPALARMDRAREHGRRLFPRARPVPGDQQPARQLLAARRRLDVELEAQRALAARRQAGHDAHHGDIASLQLRRETIRHAPMRPARSPEEADGEAGGNRQLLFPTNQPCKDWKKRNPGEGR